MTPLANFQAILGLLAIALVLPILTRRLPLPPAAALVLGGMVLAVVPGTPAIALDPDLTMVLFLPPLLLSSAYMTVWRDFRSELRPILLLAIGAVTFTTALVGWITKWMMPSLPWAACFALGAIVSPPDAVAAKAVLHGLPLPRRMVTVLEGESLVNDASGLLLYRFAVAAALTGSFRTGAAAASFVWLAVGGIGFGFLIARTSLWFMRRLRAPHEVILLTFLVSWVTYIGADLLGTSSVLAVVTCGLIVGWYQHDVMTAEGRTEAGAVWRFVITIFETLVFVLIGLSLKGVLMRLGGIEAAMLKAAPLAAAVVVTVVAARLLWVFPGIYLPRIMSASLRARDPAPPPSTALIIGWAGMRGVVSLAAALALPLQFPGRDLLLFATFSVIAATVLVQGSTLAPLIRLFLKPVAERTGRVLLDEYGVRARVAEASLRALEEMPPAEVNGLPRHPQLIEEYRRRVRITQRVREQGDSIAPRRHAHFAAWIEALAAGRAELIKLHRAGEIHDSTLLDIESELDLEELHLTRLRGLGPAE